jgi:hypothetical protein
MSVWKIQESDLHSAYVKKGDLAVCIHDQLLDGEYLCDFSGEKSRKKLIGKEIKVIGDAMLEMKGQPRTF